MAECQVYHKDLVTGDLHVIGYIQSNDPGAVGVNISWIDTSLGSGKWVIKIRNSTDTAWETVSTSNGGGSTGPQGPTGPTGPKGLTGPTGSVSDDLTTVITQSNHNFNIGDVLYFNGTIYAKAIANDPDSAEVVGIVSEVLGEKIGRASCRERV